MGATIADGQGSGTITNDDAARSDAVDQRRDRDRGQLRHAQRQFTVTPLGRQQLRGDRQLRDRQRHRHRGQRLRGQAGTLSFAAGQTTQDHRRRRGRRHHGRSRTRPSSSTCPAPSGATARRRAGPRARSRTTTPARCRRSRSMTSTVTEGNSGTTHRRFTVTPLGRQQLRGDRQLRDRQRQRHGGQRLRGQVRHAQLHRGPTTKTVNVAVIGRHHRRSRTRPSSSTSPPRGATARRRPGPRDDRQRRRHLDAAQADDQQGGGRRGQLRHPPHRWSCPSPPPAARR